MLSLSTITKDPADFAHGPIDIVINHLISVPIGQRQLVSGLLQTTLDSLWVFGSTATEPLFELLDGTRPEEDGNRVGIPAHDGECAMDVYPQDYPLAGLEASGYLAIEGSIPPS
jgi:hypothetical protein